MEAVVVINIEDPVKGSIHQVTVEQAGSRRLVRIDGVHEFTKCAIALYESFGDHFAGLEDINEYLS